MSITFQVAVLNALETEISVLNTAARQPQLRAILQPVFSNTGTLHVLDDWDEVVRVKYDFQDHGATLVIDHEPNTVMGGPKSDRVFHLSPSDSQETKRLLAAWRKRIDEYRDAHKVGAA